MQISGLQEGIDKQHSARRGEGNPLVNRPTRVLSTRIHWCFSDLYRALLTAIRGNLDGYDHYAATSRHIEL
jgi:hypothetical protein